MAHDAGPATDVLEIGEREMTDEMAKDQLVAAENPRDHENWLADRLAQRRRRDRADCR
jgi:hypothetical protein